MTHETLEPDAIFEAAPPDEADAVAPAQRYALKWRPVRVGGAQGGVVSAISAVLFDLAFEGRPNKARTPRMVWCRAPAA